MTRSEVLSLLKSFNLSPNKKLGQNFLCDDNTVRRIVECAGIARESSVLEIGPGLGALTEGILATGCTLTCVEIDSGMFRLLSQKFEGTSVNLVHADFLKTEIPGNFDTVCANLPYYCASEILFRCAEIYAPATMCVMLQREMAERIISKPGTPEYGAMTIMLSLRYDSAIAFHVNPASFYPAPDVTSSILLMKINDRHSLNEREYETVANLVKAAFWGRRKTLVKCCSSSPHFRVDKPILLDALRSCGINDTVRGETLSPSQYVELARSIIALQGQSE
jgi:16S rRNA (adenine1518-N6/adenine1519-N6)-dimethyltransferase